MDTDNRVGKTWGWGRVGAGQRQGKRVKWETSRILSTINNILTMDKMAAGQ